MSKFIDAGLLANIQAEGGKYFAADVTIEDLELRMIELNNQAKGIQQVADSEGRAASPDEEKQIFNLMNEFDEVQAEKLRRERLEAQGAVLDKSNGRVTDHLPPGETPAPEDGQIMVNAHQAGVPNAAQRPLRIASATRIEDAGPGRRCFGFHNIGEFAACVCRASARGGVYDQRLRLAQAPTSSSSEGVSADGGFAVPPDFRDEIMRKVLVESPLFGFTDQQTSSSNSITFPKDETTPWGTAGVHANWTGEGSAIAQTKVALGEETVKLEKLASLHAVTEELLEDAPALGRFLSSKVSEDIGFKIDNAIINGTGTGMPLGVLASPALLTVDGEDDQEADTIIFMNIVKMWAALYGRGQNKAIWIVSPSVATQLMTMSFPGSGTAVPVYLPPGGLADSPYAKLLGRPIVATEAAAALGSPGDIILMDPTKYMTVTKSTGLRAEVSMHLFFDYDVTAFRFVMRIGGKPWWSAPITGRDGVTKYSAFVALAEREGPPPED
ncbi:MAG: phage major capsid protein [Desulfovibrio sp.]|jgi:HK97 family phage major capsid protein|nr:phage major capsid protein [Desulfovibrio sp.]